MLLTPFLIGIDLGTTNCAVAYVDTRTRRRGGSLGAVRFAVPQLVAPHEVRPHPVLPSFLYLGDARDREAGTLSLPWNADATDAAGLYARDHGALIPSRQVASAKSWLAHADVDRTAPLLPFGRDPGEPGVSPLDASVRLLTHIRDAWNHTMAAADGALRLERQQVVLTVPASFDDEARELTAEAAARAGLAHLVLLEEPIAALYAWLVAARRSKDRPRIAPGQLVLVCDVGGGTTDLSLIRASTDAAGGFERVAIGEHLLLGGDNLDLALAALAEQRMGGGRLSIVRREAVRRQCTAAKERLLSDPTLASVSLTVLGGGRAVVGGAAVVELRRDDVVGRLLDGFLPMTAPDDRPARDRRRGLRELGLPFEPEPAITRHLAAFLAQGGTAMRRPDAVLFNGGFFTPAIARDRVIETLASWFGEAPLVLRNDEPEAAVALGAASYAALGALPDAPRDLLVRAASPRTYYVELARDVPRVDAADDAAPPDGGADAAPQSARVVAVTVMPRGTQEGTRVDLAERRFRVRTNRPVAFTLWSSTTRSDAHGEVVDVDASELHSHAPLAAVLRFGRKSAQPEIDVMLSVGFTEVGTLELWLASTSTDHRWRLQFSARGAASTAADEDASMDEGVVVSDDAVAAAAHAIRAVYSGGGEAPTALPAVLEERLGYGRAAWPLAVLRRLADVLIECAPGRTASASHETRWLNLVGFCVRPGFGAPADAWRVGELRKIYTAGLAFPKDVQGQAEWLVLWQRVAGGFSAGQQQELARRLIASLGVGARKAPRLHAQIERESWRLLASLERIDAATRVRVGDALAEKVRRDPRNANLVWALGRVGARAPFHGPLDRIVPPAEVARWIEVLLAAPPADDVAGALAQMVARTGDVARDVEPALSARVLARLDAMAAPADVRALAAGETPVDRRALDARSFGESLPAGLTLIA